MNIETYDKIWEEVVCPSIERIYEECIGEGNKYSFRMRDLNKIKKGVFRDYNLIKNRLKDRYYQKNSEKNDESLIDAHKIAACICYSLVRNKPFSFNVEEDMPQNVFVSNYSVAYYSSIGIVYMTLIAEYLLNDYKDYAQKLIENGKFIEPPISKNHNNYNEGRIFSLAQNDLYGNTFDVLGYADMMYWIELFNRQMIEDTVKPVELDRMKEK